MASQLRVNNSLFALPNPAAKVRIFSKSSSRETNSSFCHFKNSRYWQLLDIGIGQFKVSRIIPITSLMPLVHIQMRFVIIVIETQRLLFPCKQKQILEYNSNMNHQSQKSAGNKQSAVQHCARNKTAYNSFSSDDYTRQILHQQFL